MKTLIQKTDEGIKIKPHRGQQLVLEAKERFVAMICGTGGGKTSLIPVWLLQELRWDWENGIFDSAYLVVSPTYSMQRRFIVPAITDLFDAVTGGVLSNVDRCYYLPQGNKIYLGSADNPFTLEGVHVYGVCLDEAGQMRREAWDVALRRVGFYQGRILITTTPYNNRWLKTEFYDKWKAGLPEYRVVQFASVENPAYPREEFERARRDLPDWMFRMFYMGEFAKPEGLVYQDFNPSVHVVEPFDIPKNWTRIVGVDFGYNNPFAVLWLAIDGDNNIYVYREYYEREKLPKEAGEDIVRLSEGEMIDAVICDPSRPEGMEDLRRLGLPVQAADNSVLTGIQRVTEKLKARQLFVFRGLQNTLNEFEAYSWKVINGAQSEQPVKEFDHSMDALRYAIMYITSTLERRNVKGIDILRGARIYDKSV